MFLDKRKYNIRGAMRGRKITQKKLAKILKLSESYITRLINGERYNQEFECYIYFNFNVDYKRLR